MKWQVGEAKQRLSELLRSTGAGPQRIFSRDRFVAAVVSAEEFEQFEAWRDVRRQRTLGSAVEEVRELCAEDGYELDVGERRDREDWTADGD